MSATHQEIQLTQELEQLLSEGTDTARAREQAAFDNLAGPFARDIVLFGGQSGPPHVGQVARTRDRTARLPGQQLRPMGKHD